MSVNQTTTQRRTDVTQARPEWEREWRDAAAIDRADSPQRRLGLLGWLFVVAVAVVAGLLPALFPLSPGYRMNDTTMQIFAAAVAALVSVGVIPLVSSVVHGTRRHGLIVFGVAALSAGAAAIHFAVAKGHFDEYFLFGLFFVLSGVAQLCWAVLILFRPSPMFLALGAVGNLLIVALWGVDRIWGLPIGPEHWKPEPVGFADVAASVFEVALALGCIVLLVRRRHVGGASRRAALAFALTLAVMALTAAGLLSAVGVGSPVITPSA